MKSVCINSLIMESHIYTPEVESYAFEDIILWKIEKVLVNVTDKNPQLYYICIDEDGFRTVLSNEDDEVDTFILAAPGVIRESTLNCVQGNFVESAQSEVIEELVKYGIKSVLKEDGTICPIEDCE